MDSENSKTSDPHRLLVNLSDKINLKRSDNMLLYQILVFTIHDKLQEKSHKDNKSAVTWNEEFELPDGSNFCIRYLRLF